MKHVFLIDGHAPTFEGIASGDYPISRGLYFYVKKEHFKIVPALKEYVLFWVQDRMIGDNGVTVDKGLIPLPAADRKKLVENVKKELD